MWKPNDEKAFWEDKDNKETYEYLKVKYGGTYDQVRHYIRDYKRFKEAGVTQPTSSQQTVADDLITRNNREQGETLKRKYQEALEMIETLKNTSSVMREIFDHKPVPFTITETTEDNESVAFAIASDWHIEEYIRGSTINYLNEFTINIAQKRATEFFENTKKLIDMCRSTTHINTLVLAFLGDFISGNIHDELLETNQLSPCDAVIFVQDLIISGINYLLNTTDLNLVLTFNVGNHGRITKKCRNATENGNSLEYLMYHSLVRIYANNSRVQTQISEGYLNYLNVYDKVIRFHHGHAVNYYGGVGGITIPVNKAIAQWNKGRKADLDVFGHFHQYIRGNNFICNGSLIGFNAFAIRIKAEFEPPRQAFFLFDKKRGKTVEAPISFSV